MTHGLTHPPHLTVAALVDSDSQETAFYGRDLGWSGHAVLQFDARPQPGKGSAVDPTFDVSEVFLLDAETGVGEAMGKIAVVGQQEEALGVGVKAPYRKDAGILWNEVDYGSAALWIFGRGNYVNGLVERVVHESGLGSDRCTVYCYFVVVGVDSPAELGNLSVDSDTAAGDQVVANSPAAIANCSENLLQAFARILPVRRMVGSIGFVHSAAGSED